MPTINPTLPSDGDAATVAAYNPVLVAILALINGQLDGDNIATGSLPWSVMDTFTNSIPAAAMEDEGNAKKFRDEANINFVASGLVVSDVSVLNGAMTAGVLYAPDGSRVSVNSVSSRGYTASKDTYVDVSPAGSISYTEVANGAASPALTANYTRIAKVVTDGTEITSVTTTGKDSLGNLIYPTRWQGEGVTSGSDGAVVATSQTTTSTSYTDLATAGPSVTVVVPPSGRILVIVGCSASNSVVNDASVMSFELSGANTLAGSDSRAVTHRAYDNGESDAKSRAVIVEGLTPGSTTVKAVYRSSGGTATFSSRDIAAIPLG